MIGEPVASRCLMESSTAASCSFSNAALSISPLSYCRVGGLQRARAGQGADRLRRDARLGPRVVVAHRTCTPRRSPVRPSPHASARPRRTSHADDRPRSKNPPVVSPAAYHERTNADRPVSLRVRLARGGVNGAAARPARRKPPAESGFHRPAVPGSTGAATACRRRLREAVLLAFPSTWARVSRGGPRGSTARWKAVHRRGPRRAEGLRRPGAHPDDRVRALLPPRNRAPSASTRSSPSSGVAA